MKCLALALFLLASAAARADLVGDFTPEWDHLPYRPKAATPTSTAPPPFHAFGPWAARPGAAERAALGLLLSAMVWVVGTRRRWRQQTA